MVCAALELATSSQSDNYKANDPDCLLVKSQGVGHNILMRFTSTILLGSFSLSIFCTPLVRAAEDLVADVNGKKLTRKDLSDSLGTMNPSLKADILSNPVSRRQVVEQRVDEEVLRQEVARKKIESDPEFLAMMQEMKKQAAINLLIKRQVDDKITEKLAKHYYEVNRHLFRTDQMKARQIVVKTAEVAKKVYDLANKPGADFEALVMEYSEDPAKKKTKGELGFFPRGIFNPEFSDAVFEASKGDVVGPLRTYLGYHIVQIQDRDSGKEVPFPDAEIQVRARIRQENLAKYLAELKKAGKVRINEKFLK